MRPSDGVIRFGEWLPDQPDLNNQGLIEATNVLDLEGSYKPFRPLGTTGMDALDSEPLGGIVTELYTYVGLADSLYRSTTVLGTWTDYSQTTYPTTTVWNFLQFDEFIIAQPAGTAVPQVQEIGDSKDFANLATNGTCPVSNAIGKIGRFVMIGHTATDQAYVRWSAIDAPRDWPTPGTAEAQTKQAGEQYLRSDWGRVKAIYGGDQFGIIFQQGGITRVTYIGGEAVFQFDELEGSIGTDFPRSIVPFDGGWYYLSKSGFYFTDGVRCIPIGAGKIDNYMATTALQATSNRLWGAIDTNRKLIFWALQSNLSNAYCDKIIAYNTVTKRFTLCNQNLNCLLSQPFRAPALSPPVSFRAFNTSHAGRLFDGSVGTATITTGEVEFHPGGRTTVQGVKPLVSLVASVTPTVTVALAGRSSQDADDVTFSSESTPHSRTGFAGFRSDAQYHRARVTITGEFDEAMGLEVQAVPSGAA